MKLYRPILIESADQAEALPEGTVAHRVLKFESIWETLEQPEVAVKFGRNAWNSTAVDADSWDWLDQHLVGWTALVPIEAKEETTHEMRTSRGVENFAPSHGIFSAPSRRLVTPWEEAQ